VSLTKRGEPNVRMPALCFGGANFEPRPGHPILTEAFVISVGLSRDRPSVSQTRLLFKSNLLCSVRQLL